MSFDNQNGRAKIRLEMGDGVLVEVPLAVVVRAIQDRYMVDAAALAGQESLPTAGPKTRVHWMFPDFFADEEGKRVHLVVERGPWPTAPPSPEGKSESISQLAGEALARRLRDRLHTVEHRGYLGQCIIDCKDGLGHDPDCPLAADLAEAERVLGPKEEGR